MTSSLSESRTLSNKEITSSLTFGGNGHLVARECFLTSHRPSPDDGLFFFIRNLASKRTWSATFAPTRAVPDRYEWRIGKRQATYERDDGDIRTMLDVLVPQEGAFELRRLTLENRGNTDETFEVTSYVDVILLFDRQRDTDHQTFSNMFIGAEFRSSIHALIYHRRFFDNPERFPFFMHRIFLDHFAEFSGFETDREAFFGRGKSLDRPISLDRPLRNTAGYILDPLAALRTRLTLPAHTSATLFSINSAHFSPEQPETCAKQFSDTASVEAFFQKEKEDLSGKTVEHIKLNTASLEVFQKHSRPENTVGFEKKSLLFWNSFGGFDPETHDYHMDIRPDDLPPQPWANIISNPHFGTMTTENALGTTWFKNSRNGRLSPWSNNPVTDPPAEILFVKEKNAEDTGEIWSLTPSPLPASSHYQVTHGTGFTRYESSRNKLSHSLLISVHPERPIKYFAITLENQSEEKKDLSLATYIDTPRNKDESLQHESSSLLPIFTEENHVLLLDQTFFKETPDQSLFSALITSIPMNNASFDRRSLTGDFGSIFCPTYWQKHPITPTVPDRAEHLAAISEHIFSLSPQETKRIVFALIAADSEDQLDDHIHFIREIYSQKDSKEWENCFSTDYPRATWEEMTHHMALSAPQDPSLEILFNTWLPYQMVSSRLWAKMGFYQPGGAYGFRDQLQDALARLYADPGFTRSHILEAAQEQYEDGNVRVWWFPDSDLGVRSRTSDNPLWLPFVADEYVRRTGDSSIYDETIPFIDFPSDDNSFYNVGLANRTASSGALLEHCRRALEYTLVFGQHSLPLIREGDWNDGMNRVGKENHGESVWLGFFLFDILCRYARRFDNLGDRKTGSRYDLLAKKLRATLNTDGWDGHWFRRAFYDDGEPLGSEINAECRIDAIAQSWSILSGAGDPEKSREAMDNLERFLYDPEARILKLIDPPFNDLTKKNPGYIKDYPPGIRENGSQYNHAVFWAAAAFALIGRFDRVSELILAANPIRRSESERKARLYETEPYAVAADIYSAEHRGKGGWTWYTASAGLLYRTLIEVLFGINIENDRVTIHPSLPSDWSTCSLSLPWKTAHFTFVFSTEKSHQNAIQRISLDRLNIIPDERGFLPLPNDGKLHRFEIELV